MSHVLQCKQFEIAYLLLAFHARARLLIRTTRFYRQSDNPHVMWHTVKAPCQASSSGREGDSAASDTDPDVLTQAVAWAQPQSAVGSDGSLSLKAYAHQHGFALPAGAQAMAAAAGLPRPGSLRALLQETATIDAGSGSTITMIANDGQTLSTSSIVSSQSIRCQYVGPQPS
jgi:hypothetical protein